MRASDAATWAALELAAGEIRAFHEKARRNSWLDFKGDGALGQVIRPLRRVGLYAPGGRALYPSTVLMAAVPARVAGVRRDRAGLADPGRMATSHRRCWRRPRSPGSTASSASAARRRSAALAFGTESVPRVDKIVGPGNLFVVLAKRRSPASLASTDCPARPSA